MRQTRLTTKRGVRGFACDDSGAIAVMFALLLLPMLGLTLTAIDYGRALRLESRLQTAADSASSAAVHKLGLSRQEIEATARQHLDAQLPAQHKGMPFALTIGNGERSLEIRLETTIATTLIGILGLDKFTVRVASEAYAARPVITAKSIEQSIEAVAPRGAPPEVTRALEELARQGGLGTGSGAQRGPTPEQQEEIRRAADEANRMIQDALSRIGR
jgi:Flp pilus assembly protein TadG